MARSDKQGLQIALIVFVMLTIVLSITTFLFFKASEEAEVKSVADGAAAQKAATDMRAAIDELRAVKEMIGVTADEDIEKVKEIHAADMGSYASTFTEEKQSYREALEALMTSFGEVNDERIKEREELIALAKRVDELEGSKEATHENNVQLASTAVTERTKRESELASQEKQRIADYNKLKSEKNTAEQENAALEQEKVALKQQSVTEQKKLQDRLDNLIVKNNELTKSTFEVPDGEIRLVNQTARTVWLNLGRADSLQPRITFSVWGRDANDLTQTNSKAKIEVTNILGEHLAEARIVEDALSDPILPGDRVFTPLWSPGQQLRFALAGLIDVNGDGRSDLQMVRDLISLNGGAVDAYVDEKNVLQGAVTVETRYLVEGKEPEKGRDKFDELKKQANAHGVETVTLDKFLDQMGWKDPSRVVEFGRGADPKDFLTPAEGELRSAPGTTSGSFAPRAPRGSAFQPR